MVSVMPTHFFDQFELGVSARKAGFTIQPRRRRLPTVMLMSRRAWCQETGSPRSREAFQSNPPVTNRSVILKFYLMNFAAFANAGERDTPVVEMQQVGPVQIG